jgi:hypothetical protein
MQLAELSIRYVVETWMIFVILAFLIVMPPGSSMSADRN